MANSSRGANRRRPRTTNPARAADPARLAAFEALRAVHSEGAYANLALALILDRQQLTAQDAAFATELLAGTCRMQGTYDEILTAAASRSLSSLQPAVLDLLRLGTHQLLNMRVPPHAAVSATVQLSVATVGERVRGLVNAVLRKVAARTWSQWTTELSAGRSAIAALALRTAHPTWIVQAYAELLPAAELELALLANNVSAPVTLAVRPGLAEVGELTEAGAQPGRFSPYAAFWSGNPSALAAIRHGTAGVQDEGSQLATIGLANAESTPNTGWWLDLCAGPGGKTALLAGLADSQRARLLATEIVGHRARLVAQGSRRYPSPPSVLVADGTRPAWRPATFDRVLADVPCTGLGALRRRPESRWRRTTEDLADLGPLQTALLRSALAAVAVGGVVAYVTCSPHQAETTAIVSRVLASEPGVRVLPAQTVFPDLPPDAFLGHYLQLWPHRHGTDAMFAAYLRRETTHL